MGQSWRACWGCYEGAVGVLEGGGDDDGEAGGASHLIMPSIMACLISKTKALVIMKVVMPQPISTAPVQKVPLGPPAPEVSASNVSAKVSVSASGCVTSATYTHVMSALRMNLASPLTKLACARDGRGGGAQQQ